MNISNYSRIDKVSKPVSNAFKVIGKGLRKIDFMMIIIIIGLAGWIFGLFNNTTQTVEVFGLVFVTVLLIGFLVIEAEDIGRWFTFWFVVFGFAGYYFAGQLTINTIEEVTGNYMIDLKQNNNSLEYIGADNMTKTIVMSDEIMHHYNRFKDSSRFIFVKNTKTNNNIILVWLGIKYDFNKQQWISLRDKVAEKNLFTIK